MKTIANPAWPTGSAEARPMERRRTSHGTRLDTRRAASALSWRSLLVVARELGMGMLALAGLACLVWLILSNLFALSLVTFATGSMAPTIPTGSVAIVQEIPASELKVGDVATLERAGMGLPVTHRVTAVEPSTAGPDLTVVSMQGDANPIPDVFPYYVDSAKVVLWSVADGAVVIQVLTNPLVLGTLTLGIGSLVIWAFWPRGARRRPAHRSTTPAPTTSALEPFRRLGIEPAESDRRPGIEPAAELDQGIER
jgi:signal peptidase